MCLLQMPVWISYVQTAIYTKPSGYFFRVCHLCLSVLFSPLRCQTPPLPGNQLSLGTTVTGLYTSYSPPPPPPPSFGSFSRYGFFFLFPVDLIMETFQQIAGENITPKLVVSRGEITMLFTSVQIS